jgi:tetratricopeptide (TPR) repeat protein
MTVDQLLEEAKMPDKTWRYNEALVSYEQALAAYNKALELNPKHFSLLVGRAGVLKKLLRYEEAVEELKKITPALQEEGIAVGIPPETALITLTRAVIERLEHPG